jgi:cystathionine beta-lyase/cystathionine gamma-synthase
MSGSQRETAAARGFGTRAVHAGERQAVPHRPAVVPIYQTAPFLFDDVAELDRTFAEPSPTGLYSRYANPTVRVVEEKIAALEGVEDAVAFASGMGAISGVLSTLLRSGDRLLAAADLYGGTSAWLGWLAERHPEIRIERRPLGELAPRLEQTDGTFRAVYFETPTNPVLTCGDIGRIARAAHARGNTRGDDRGAVVIVDNTFATPVLQRPAEHGADLVVHSATKFLGGHGDVTAGLAAGPADLIRQVRTTMLQGGACLDPHAAFLLARGMKTLALRVERQSANAARLVERLQGHPRATRVHYPGLDPVGRAQMRSGGALFAFDLAGSPEESGEAAARLVERLEVFQIIPSLGSIESGVILPRIASHRGLTAEQRAALGIGEGTVRVCCGIEDPEDLVADMEQALASLEDGDR